MGIQQKTEGVGDEDEDEDEEDASGNKTDRKCVHAMASRLDMLIVDYKL